MPHQEECAAPLPTDLWDDPAKSRFKDAELWAWNERICLGDPADMRDAPDGRGDREVCRPSEVERKKGKVPDYRKLRPEFLELILSHEPWASAARHPQVFIQCALVPGDLVLDDHEIAPTFKFREGKIDGKVSLLGTNFQRTLSLRGSTVTGMLRADRLEVGGSLFLNDGGRFAAIRLLGAKIAGSVSLSGSTFTRMLNADRLGVGGSLHLREGKFAGIDLPGARVGRDIHLAGSTFSCQFDLTGAVVGGDIDLNSTTGELQLSPTWDNCASLILRHTKADVLQARAGDWEMSGPDNLLPTDLTGFTFNRLGGPDKSPRANMGDQPAAWLEKWIEAQHDHGKHYDPQPYTQLAQVLEAAGATDKAKEIRYARFEHRRDYEKSRDGWRWVWLAFERCFWGYKLYPFRVLWWFGGLVVLGGLLALCSDEPSVRGWMSLWYSLENALPIIETNEGFKNIDHGKPWVKHLFHFQKVMGFVMATVVVGALTIFNR